MVALLLELNLDKEKTSRLYVLLTDKGHRDDTLRCYGMLQPKEFSTHLRLEGLNTRRSWYLGGSIRTQAWDEDILFAKSGRCSTSSCSCPDSSRRRNTKLKGIWRCGGGFLPLYCTISSLSSDAVGVSQGLYQLTSSKVITLHTACFTSKVLNTVKRSPRSIFWSFGNTKQKQC